MGALWLAVTVSLAHAFASRMPDWVLALRPSFAEAHAELALNDPAKAEVHARAAIRRSAFEPAAFRALGMRELRAGNIVQADNLFGYSETLSRRDAAVQLMLIEAAVRRGDIAGALSHYRTALTTDPASKQMLFPTLVQAVGTTPELIEPIASLAAPESGWRDELIFRIAGETTRLENAERFYNAIREKGGGNSPEAARVLLSRLVSAGRVNAALRTAQLVLPSEAGAVRNSDFSRAPDASPFDWALANSRTATADVLRNAGRGELQFEFRADTPARLARQLIGLRPGKYRLTNEMVLSSGSTATSGLRWSVSCAEGRALATFRPKQAGMLEVPAGCEGQWLELVVSGEGGAEWVSGSAQYVEIRPVGQS